MLNKPRNPFLVMDFHVPYIQIVTKITAGQIETYYNMEQATSFKVYTNVKIRSFLFQSLSMYARDMLTAIQHFTHSDNQYVVLTYDKMQELYGESYKLVKRRYEDTLRELIKSGLIDCKDRAANQYWYNPVFFCQRNRITMFPEHAVKVDTIYRPIQ